MLTKFVTSKISWTQYNDMMELLHIHDHHNMFALRDPAQLKYCNKRSIVGNRDGLALRGYRNAMMSNAVHTKKNSKLYH